jgi:hypothetical protein
MEIALKIMKIILLKKLTEIKYLGRNLNVNSKSGYYIERINLP